MKLIGIAILVGMEWVGVNAVAKIAEKDIHTEVTNGAVEEYNLAKKHGDKIDICVRAGLVAESYLQGKDEANYAKWRDTERADCKRAGL